MVTFDGPNKIIIIDNGVTSISAVQIYSEWKEWVVLDNNIKFLPALRTVGGDTIGPGQVVSPYYFLTNDWRVRPYEGSHTLTVSGNLYVDGGGSPFISTLGNYNVLVTLSVSSDSKVNYVTSDGSDLTEVLSKLTSIETKVNTSLSGIDELRDVSIGNWVILGNQMIFYKRDNTELCRFNLMNKEGIPSATEVYRRIRV